MVSDNNKKLVIIYNLIFLAINCKFDVYFKIFEKSLKYLNLLLIISVILCEIRVKCNRFCS